MAKFYRMSIAFFAMTSMAVVPVSCGDDKEEDDKDDKSDGIAGKVFQTSWFKEESGGHEADIEFIKFKGNGRFEIFETYCEFTSERKEFGELKFDDEGSYYIDNNTLTLTIDGYNPEKSILTKTGNSYEFIIWGEKYTEIPGNDMNKISTEFKKAHTH